MNKEKVNSIINIFSFIPFSLVVFGILILGFFVAPVIFKELTQRPVASEVMTLIFNRYYPFAFICTIITLLMESIRFLCFKKDLLNSKIWLVQISAIIVVTFMTGYSNLKILPRINEMRETQKGPTLWVNDEFVELHKQAEMLGKGMFTFGLIPLIIMVTTKKTSEVSIT